LRISPDQPVSIVGAGLAGALLTVTLARRGCTVRLYDRRPDPRSTQSERGRSINLAMAARGIHALEQAGVMDRIRPLLIPMRGRMIHERTGGVSLQPYGQRANEVIYSVSRAALNRVLIEEAARQPAVTAHFRHTCLAVEAATGRLRFRDEISRQEYEIPIAPTVATDGAGSVVRSSLAASGRLQVREDWLDHDYKELTLPSVNGRHALDPNALHIWPRGGFMLIALPNTDGSFTATLFLARQGPKSFASLAGAESVLALFREEFPDALALMPRLTEEFHANAVGQLATVHATPWHWGGQLLLLGDAAHAIVPFHGQGMNAGFEDCCVLDSLWDGSRDWPALFREFEQLRRPDTEAIAQMALENYTEMRDTVRDPAFVRRQAIALELERNFPDRFIPRYSMVAFHPEIAYAQALRRGEIQAQILLELDRVPGALDADLARKLIHASLPPLP